MIQISIKRRFLAYALAAAIMVGAGAYRPQCADAVALTSTAAVVALVASVMTACGVTYWASTQDDAVSYLGGKIEAYLGTLTESYATVFDWLGINSISDAFSILNGGILQVPTAIANKILDFVLWFNQDENVVSGGEPVGILGDDSIVVKAPYYASNPTGAQMVSYGLKLVMTNGLNHYFVATSNNADVYVFGVYAANNSIDIYAVSSTVGVTCTGYYGMLSGSSYIINDVININSLNAATNLYFARITNTSLNPSNYGIYIPVSQSFSTGIDFVAQIAAGQASTEDLVIVTPSESVVIPPALEQGQSLVVTTTAPILDGDTNDEACQAILDTVVSQDGLSSTSTTEGEAIPSAWTWLYDVVSGISNTLNDIYDTILGIPNAIVSGISAALSAAFVPSQAYIESFIASLYSTFDNHFSILSYPFSLLGTFITRISTAGSTQPIFSWPNIYEPFSNKLIIPAGCYNLNSALDNQSIMYAYDLYMIVVKGIIGFEFVAFLYAWFCDVFHMRNDDFAAPYRDDGSDDVDDDDDDDGITYNSWSAW